MTIKRIETLTDAELIDAYNQFTNNVDTEIGPRDGYLFGFHTADILYVDYVDGKWVDVTPDGETGQAIINVNNDGTITTEVITVNIN